MIRVKDMREEELCGAGKTIILCFSPAPHISQSLAYKACNNTDERSHSNEVNHSLFSRVRLILLNALPRHNVVHLCYRGV